MHKISCLEIGVRFVNSQLRSRRRDQRSPSSKMTGSSVVPTLLFRKSKSCVVRTEAWAALLPWERRCHRENAKDTTIAMLVLPIEFSPSRIREEETNMGSTMVRIGCSQGARSSNVNGYSVWEEACSATFRRRSIASRMSAFAHVNNGESLEFWCFFIQRPFALSYGMDSMQTRK